jgi:cell wall-associated NlpC family hydrolase
MTTAAPLALDWINDYVGVPYVVNGRGRAGWDCWGLVLAVFREQRGVELPDWQREAPFDLAAQVRAFGRAWSAVQAGALAHKVEHPEHWSIAVVARRALPHHVGVVLGSSSVIGAGDSGARPRALGVLHCAEKMAGTVYDPLARFERNFPGAAWWRWEAAP